MQNSETGFSINIDKFKTEFSKDPFQFYLSTRILDCKKRRETYWNHYSRMRFRNNLISIPLLILSSGTGVSSIVQLRTTNQICVFLTTALGISSAIFTSLQKYMRYSERAEQAKYLAKNYGRLANRIQDILIFIESKSLSVDSETFINFVKELHKDLETLTQEADEMPSNLRSNPEIWAEKIKALNTVENNDKKHINYTKEALLEILGILIKNENLQPPLLLPGSSSAPSIRISSNSMKANESNNSVCVININDKRDLLTPPKKYGTLPTTPTTPTTPTLKRSNSTNSLSRHAYTTYSSETNETKKKKHKIPFR